VSRQLVEDGLHTVYVDPKEDEALRVAWFEAMSFTAP
jgi:hypothetical protein